jgi:hypothetical protein
VLAADPAVADAAFLAGEPSLQSIPSINDYMHKRMTAPMDQPALKRLCSLPRSRRQRPPTAPSGRSTTARLKSGASSSATWKPSSNCSANTPSAATAATGWIIATGRHADRLARISASSSPFITDDDRKTQVRAHWGWPFARPSVRGRQPSTCSHACRQAV